MNIHEYQAKEILKNFNVKIQEGYVANSPDEAYQNAKKLSDEKDTNIFVIKAQIHAGGRGKGKIKETGSNGVVIAKNIDDVKNISSDIIGGTLVTHQTGEEGKTVNKILIAEDVYYPGDNDPKEFYLGILLDRTNGKNVIMASTEGGVEIETVAEETPVQEDQATEAPAAEASASDEASADDQQEDEAAPVTTDEKTPAQIIESFEANQLKDDIPSFRPGDTVVVSVKVREGDRTRLQAFEGVVMNIKNAGLNSAFIVRKISSGIGVERTFQLHSPMIDSITVKRKGDVRQAKLYYLRERSGRSARIKERLD